MREPMKYINGPMGFFAPCDTYVRWADYAALAAENERLRKAGDAMLGTYIHACAKGLVDQDTAHRVVSEWAKAKEGGAK